jgi:hypothetical protein
MAVLAESLSARLADFFTGNNRKISFLSAETGFSGWGDGGG